MASNGGGKAYRSASSGRFVTKAYATRAPGKIVAETRGGGSTRGSHRSAITGKFVTASTARRHPSPAQCPTIVTLARSLRESASPRRGEDDELARTPGSVPKGTERAC